MDYLTLKLVHIISSTLLFGTGLGTAFFMFMTHRSRNVAAIATVARFVVKADWYFTTPAVLIQPLTGWLLIQRAGFPLESAWLVWAIALYLLAGVCWLPVVWLQLRMRDIAMVAHASGDELPPQYWRYERAWVLLGIPAFLAVIVVFGLMVFKPF